MLPTSDIKGVGPAMAEALAGQGIKSIEDLAKSDTQDLIALPGIGEARARRLIAASQIISRTGFCRGYSGRR